MNCVPIQLTVIHFKGVVMEPSLLLTIDAGGIDYYYKASIFGDTDKYTVLKIAGSDSPMLVVETPEEITQMVRGLDDELNELKYELREALSELREIQRGQ
jgi:hypothetical protein